MSGGSATARRHEGQPSLWEHWVPPAPGTPLFEALVAIAIELSRRPDITGVTVGEVVFEAEEYRGLKVGGLPMENKMREQRQTSWLPRVMRVAGLVSTETTRRSPVKRTHSHRHVVWIPRDTR